MSETRPEADTMARTARTMGIITAVLTALVAFNTLVYSCSNDRKAREEEVLEKLRSDEVFWTDAMRDLGTLIDKRPLMGKPDRNWEAQCDILGDRTYKLVEASEGDSDSIAAEKEIDAEFLKARQPRMRVKALRVFFQGRMLNQELVGACAIDFAKRLDQADQARRITLSATNNDITALPPQQLEDVRLQRPMIALTPPSKDRWDIDVFWCARSDQAAQSANFARAVNEGRKFAGMAQRGDRIVNQRLGRIRVRILSESAQNITGPFTYFNSGNRLLYDRNDQAEKALVIELTKRLNETGGNGNKGDLAAGLIEAKDQGRPSKWYISLFICGAGIPSIVQRTATVPAAN